VNPEKGRLETSYKMNGRRARARRRVQPNRRREGCGLAAPKATDACPASEVETLDGAAWSGCQAYLRDIERHVDEFRGIGVETIAISGVTLLRR
jgi:hypothetical protein